jgi:hypothetical protein
MVIEHGKKSTANLKSSISGLETESVNSVKVKGEVFWTLTDVNTGEVITGSKKNVVTLDAGILLARLMKGPDSPSPNVMEPNYGIYALAVGTGEPGWNPLNPPPANVFQRYLYSEIARKTFSSSNFVDVTGSPSSIPTNVIDFTFSFGTSEAVGPLVEMGLVGGDCSTLLNERNPPQCNPNTPDYDPTVSLVGKDTLCNYLTFPVINKTSSMTLSWTWRLTF